MGRKRKNNKEAKVHEDLGSLDLKINEFGEITSNIDIEKINAFLNKNVPDKKLINRYDNDYQQEFKVQETPEFEEQPEDFERFLKKGPTAAADTDEGEDAALPPAIDALPDLPDEEELPAKPKAEEDEDEAV